MAIPSKFPVRVRSGSVTVKIYRSRSSKNYLSYVVVHSVGGKRKVQTFSDYADAHNEAAGIAEKLAKGELDILQLTGADRLAYAHALAELKPTGVALEFATQEYATAQKILAGRTTLLEAVKFYVSRHKDCTPQNVADAVEELYRSKKQEGASDAYMKVLRCYLGKFSKAFNGPIGGIATTEIADFLREMDVSNRSRKNCRGVLGSFFKFCRERNWLPRDQDPLDHVPKFKGEPTDVEIYTPEELAHLFSHARSELIPYLAIAAFAGLRSAELQRLDWRDVAIEDGFITVDAKKAKTGARRIVPISENLKAWLMPYFEKTGKIVPFDNVPKQLGWLAKAAGIKWKKNALRHSFCSYRLAITKNAAQVALEAGNSPQIIFRHYHQLVRPAHAKSWFSIETGYAFPQWRAGLPNSGRTVSCPADHSNCVSAPRAADTMSSPGSSFRRPQFSELSGDGDR